MNQNDDICESIVSHANSIWNSIANLNGNQNDNGQMNSLNTSSQQTQSIGMIFIGLMIIYAVLSIIQPRRQNTQLKGHSFRQDQ